MTQKSIGESSFCSHGAYYLTGIWSVFQADPYYTFSNPIATYSMSVLSLGIRTNLYKIYYIMCVSSV